MTDSRPIGSRVSARWRIVGWLLLTVLLGQLAVITTVHSTLHADVARQANEDVIQELEEFRDLASDGRDPATARPFEDPRRLVTVFLDRQRPSPGEHLFGQFDDGQVIEAYGPATTQARALELSADPAAMAQITVANSGVMQTAAGEMRWGRIDLQDAQGQPAGRFVMGIFVAGAEQEANRVVLLLTAVCAGVLLFTAFVSWLVAGQILKPVRTMRRTAETISAYDLQQRLPVSGRDDIAALGRTVNTLLDRLQGALATEQRFVDTAGAELRDPVRRGTARLAALARENPAAGARLQPIRDDLAGMERTITELTSLAATQRATFVQPVRTTTGALAERVRGWLPTIAVRDWRETRVDELSLTADPDRLMEAVRHLAENAAEHGSPDDPIDWWIHRVEVAGDPHVEIAVRDRGPGITPQAARSAFGRFTDSGHDRDDGDAAGESERGAGVGDGLGLAVVRAIAQAHGGTAFVESEPGRGATFGLTIPTEHVPPAAVADRTPEPVS